MEEQLKKYITDNIDRCNSNLAAMKIIEEVLKPFEGKQITKRIETALKKALPDFCVNMEKQTSYFWLTLYKWVETSKGAGRIRSDNGMYMNLGYHGGSRYGDRRPERNGVFKLEIFNDSARGYYLDAERLEKYTKALKKVKQWTNVAEQIKSGYSDLYADMEILRCHYKLNDLLGFKK